MNQNTFIEEYREHNIKYNFLKNEKIIKNGCEIVSKKKITNLVITYTGEITESFQKEVVDFIKIRNGVDKVNRCENIIFTNINKKED